MIDRRDPTTQFRVGLTVLLAAFTSTCLPYFTLPPGSDSVKNLWLISHISPATYLTDTLAAAYVYRFYFEPLWSLLYFVDVALEQFVGTAAYHVVNLLGVGATAVVVGNLARNASGSVRVAFSAAAIYTLSPLGWLYVAFPPVRNYVFGILFGLLATRPFWNAYFQGVKLRWSDIVRSACFFALGVASKESVAALPLFLFALGYAASGKLVPSGLRLIPHALVLAVLIVWRLEILGSMGGYWMESTFTWSNLALGIPMLADFLWGTTLLLAIPVAALLGWDRPAIALLVAAFAATMAPFVLAGDLTNPSNYPWAAARFGLFWALAIPLCARAIGRVNLPSAVTVFIAALPLTLQTMSRDQVEIATDRLLPKQTLAQLDAAGPLVVVSDESMSLAHEHQLRGEGREPLVAYQTKVTAALDKALGFEPPEGATFVNPPPPQLAPTVVPLALDESEVWHSEDGHLHIHLDKDAVEGLTLTWVHINGPTRWLVTLPIGRREITLPLTYSVHSVILSRLSTAEKEWPTYEWESPFFRPRYP